ncbi:M48 family metallopeptidase [Pseudoroseicyclus tamaricis]|uniref:M48 family metallopeptidase n=1 Tax=Pseudoroseicyclus tamaricis TaxID=2705421 RepID=A0A6B2JVC0_9RHOB|nr:SprT family zinc-dependent metalloprotease [Pseudoroseicyclus tamaricis]NDV02447.1 M48 family metallopeptidase [Pseudoroseicyclus tamaricis]
MAHHVLPGDPPVTVALRRSARARRYTLRVSHVTGEAVLTLPARAREADGLAFVAERADWLRAQLAARPEEIRPAPGGTIPFLGKDVLLRPAAVRRVSRDGAALVVPEEPRLLAPRLAAFLKEEARARLLDASERHAATLGARFGRITLRDPRGRWGSCSSRGDLMYSWRLVLAPPPVLDYVAAHEVAHLREMNHAPAFWALVARLCPGEAAQRRWLKEHGSALHRLRLD